MGERVEDRCLGAILGLTIGDALGVTLEFQAPGSFSPLDYMLGGGCLNLPPGYWTDDTSMALCLAESLTECDGFDAGDPWSGSKNPRKAGNGSLMRLAPVPVFFRDAWRCRV